MQEITPNVNEEKAAAEVHSYIKDMVAKYHHRPIPTTPAAGNVILSIPYAGYISMYLQSTRGKIILVSVIVALFIAGLILPQEKNQEEVKNE